MYCPFCQAVDTKVVDSRLINDGEQVRRRRECLHCEERFTTYEIIELSLPRVVKRDGSREAFYEEKLRKGVLKAVEKRSISAEQIEASIHHMIHKLRASGEREVTSQYLGELVMEALRELDGVAYVRFASVYRSFKDVDDFNEEIRRLRQHHEDENL